MNGQRVRLWAFAWPSFQHAQALSVPPRGTERPNTYFHFLAEGSIGAILQLALVVHIIDHSRGNDLGLQAFLLGNVIKTEPPASAEKKFIEMRAGAYGCLHLESFIQQKCLPFYYTLCPSSQVSFLEAENLPGPQRELPKQKH